jgi:nicotinamide riboside kinase
MKIYICGSHSCGKTTLARYVSGKYKLPMITEVARMILSEKELNLDSLRTNLDVVDNYQSDIFYRQIQEEKKHESFVSDRSFDCLAYAAQHSRTLPNLLNSPEMTEYLTGLRDKKTVIFFVRPSKATLKEDGVRESLNWDGVIAIDSMIKFMLEMWNLSYFQINIGNMQERVKFIDSVLSLKK